MTHVTCHNDVTLITDCDSVTTCEVSFCSSKEPWQTTHISIFMLDHDIDNNGDNDDDDDLT